MYKRIWRDGHSVPEHRIVMENAIGRSLKQEELVHHIDGNPLNNRIENLTIMSKAEHQRHHGHLRRYQLDRRVQKLLELDGQEYQDELKRLVRWL